MLLNFLTTSNTCKACWLGKKALMYFLLRIIFICLSFEAESVFSFQTSSNFLQIFLVQIKEHQTDLKDLNLENHPDWQKLNTLIENNFSLEEAPLGKEIKDFFSTNKKNALSKSDEAVEISPKEMLDSYYIKIEEELKKNSSSSWLFLGLSAAYLKHHYYAQSLECLYKLYKSDSRARILYEAVQRIYSYKQKGSGQAFLK